MRSVRRCLQVASRHNAQPHPHTTTTQTRPNTTNAIIHNAPSNPPPRNNANGTLNGKTIAIKDNIVTASAPTTAASQILHQYTSPFDATVVQLLKHHGASVEVKTNLDEFGMGSHTQHSASGPVLSPYRRNGIPLSPGGSSGGSAVAVARGECWAALGTDTGGSVRLPAAYTGTVGFKPSYGLISRWGVIQYANSLDTVGVLARSVADARRVFAALNVYDAQDPTSLPPSVRARINAAATSNPVRHRLGEGVLRIGVPTTYNINELTPPIRATYKSILTNLQSHGHTLVPISLPSTQHALSAYYVLAPAEASSNLAKYDGVRYGTRTSGADAAPKDNMPLYAATRGEGFGDEVRRRVLLGAYTLSSEARDNYFVQAQKVRRLVQRDFDRVFALPNPMLDYDDITSSLTGAHEHDGESADRREDKVDVIMTPAAPTLPPTVEEVKALTPVERYMNDVFTVPASLACLPAACIPVPLPRLVRDGLGEGDVRNAGMQVVGQFGDDELVLRVAEMVERLAEV